MYSLIMTSKAGSGHPTTCLSAADVTAAIFDAMHYDPHNFDNPDNDRFVLSKGHASPLLYAAWKEVGVISESDLYTYRNIDSPIEGHPTLRFKYAEAATGSLGMGLSIGAGMALSAKIDKRAFRTYVLLGDGEIAEGSIWEAAELVHYYKLDNLIAIVDCNRLGQSAPTIHEHHVHRYEEKFKAFGWHTLVIDGHDMHHIVKALQKAREHKDHPTVIIAKTFKGHPITRVEDKIGFHGKAFEKEEVNEVLQELAEKYPDSAVFDEKNFDWKPKVPEVSADVSDPQQCIGVEIPDPLYKFGDMVPTRKAYGKALADLGDECKSVVCLDAEVKNSTFTDIFEERHPDRFVQCFIAEQNMVSMGVGMERRGKIPFISTFASFFSRAYDQIRMAAIGNSSLRLVGSHAGISIGQDGPSQMGLEDIALMRALPGSVVLYPSDAISTHKLIGEMGEYNQGISYLRTTRMATPVLYDSSDNFPIGGCKVVKQSESDDICLIGAGVTLHEALKAYKLLIGDSIVASVIDLYSIKPLDIQTIIDIANKSGKKVITIEDHYLESGLGQAITYVLRNTNIHIECLAVTELPRSGKPEELLALMKINAGAIVQKVKMMLTKESKTDRKIIT